MKQPAAAPSPCKQKNRNVQTTTFPTDAQRRQFIGQLHAEQCSCVVSNGRQTRIFRQRGVKDLFRLLTEEPELLGGAFVADKVVGKGAAALMILGGVREVYADVMSAGALELFARSGVRADSALHVPHIVNRAGTGWCPVETLCRDCRTAEECLEPIRKFILSVS